MSERDGWIIARSIASWLLLAVFLACLAGLVWWVRAGSGGEGADVFGYRSFVVASGSMEPDFQVNGLAVTHAAPFDQVKVGDVVAFRAAGLGGAPALHRVISTGHGQLLVKGDNNPHPDGAPVTPANYIGRVVFHTNLTAFLWNQEHGPYGLLRIVVLPLAALVLIWIAVHYLLSSQRRSLTRVMSGFVIAFFLLTSITAAYAIYLDRQQQYIISTLGRYASRFEQGPATESVQVEQSPVEGTIDIPSLGIHYPIVEYVAASSLTVAITRFAGPGLDQTGNVVLVGHHSWGNLFFTRISRLRTGDLIRVTDGGRQTVTYAVTGHRLIGADDTSVLDQPGDGQRHLTLIAAPYDMLSGYVVTAEAASGNGQVRAPAVPAATSVLPGAAIPVAIGLGAAAVAGGAAWLAVTVIRRRRAAPVNEQSPVNE